ncbi:unnamed protein product [Lactuca saligna]|uniref:Uncharacterized protein n=1 Tax=Lactuca saligna TaxID=75948 RepID=A0AA36E7Y0_LACSI|nr:unnamed protein product [Lactuca saligna]
MLSLPFPSLIILPDSSLCFPPLHPSHYEAPSLGYQSISLLSFLLASATSPPSLRQYLSITSVCFRFTSYFHFPSDSIFCGASKIINKHIGGTMMVVELPARVDKTQVEISMYVNFDWFWNKTDGYGDVADYYSSPLVEKVYRGSTSCIYNARQWTGHFPTHGLLSLVVENVRKRYLEQLRSGSMGKLDECVLSARTWSIAYYVLKIYYLNSKHHFTRN